MRRLSSKGRGSLMVNVGHPIVTNVILCTRGGNAAFPKLLWDFLFRNEFAVGLVRHFSGSAFSSPANWSIFSMSCI